MPKLRRAVFYKYMFNVFYICVYRYLEQEFLCSVLEPLIDMEQTGPVYLQVGSGENARVLKFMIKLNCYISDNEGSHKAICCKSKNTFLPCRICEISREDLMRSDIATVALRQSNMYKPYLEEAFDAYCHSIKVRKSALSKRELEVLQFCKDKSVLPILPAFFKLRPSYPGHSAYERVPPDHLHTITGILEYWFECKGASIYSKGCIRDDRND